MKILLIGATGYIGSAVAEALLAAGHSVTGLARSPEAEQTLKQRGIAPVAGDLKASLSLPGAVEGCDGVIFAGTTNDGHLDTEAVVTLLSALKGSNRAFIYTSGIWVLGNTGDTAVDETAPLHPPPIVSWRPEVERVVLEAANEGVRTIVIRPAIVYGRGQGLPGLYIQSANQYGSAHYIGDGENRWPMVEVEDLASLYVLALEKAPAGSLYHGVDGPSFKTRDIAEAASFGADAGGKVAPWPVPDAQERMGVYLVDALLLDQNVSGEKAKQELGWAPRGVSVVQDLRYGSYAMNRVNP